jgi:hypothetical protein
MGPAKAAGQGDPIDPARRHGPLVAMLPRVASAPRRTVKHDEQTALYQQTCELGRGMLGSLSAGESSARAVMLRHVEADEHWTPSLLDALSSAARAAKVVHHPCLLSVIDVRPSDEGVLIATEYVEGVPLSTLLARARDKKRRVPEEVATRIVTELGRAIANVNELPAPRAPSRPITWVHPECVVISSGDDALLCDIGVLSLESLPDRSELGKLRAPELGERDSESASPRAGVYSLGALLGELLGDDPTPGLSDIVARSTHEDPAERFAGPRELAEALAARGKQEPGGLVRFMNDMAPDLVERQRATLVVPHAAAASWRPTVTGLEEIQVPDIPRAPGLGLATLDRPTVEIAVDEEDGDGGRDEPVVVDAPVVQLTKKRVPQETLPLLLVNKPPVGSRSGDAEPEVTSSRPPGQSSALLWVALAAVAAGAVAWAATRSEPAPAEPAAETSTATAPQPSAGPISPTRAPLPETMDAGPDAAIEPARASGGDRPPRWSSDEERKQAAEEAAKTMLEPPAPAESSESAPLRSDNPY